MMNGRQRSPSRLSSHESGSTTMKKIAKVAVGKSTRLGSAAEAAGCYSGCGGGRRVAALSSAGDVEHGVVAARRRTTTDRPGSAGLRDRRCRRRARRSRIASRAAAHSASATRSQAPTITPAITGASSPATAASDSDGDEEEDLEQEPRDGEAARVAASRRTAPSAGSRERRAGLRPSRGAHRSRTGATRVSARSACTSAWRPPTCDASERTAPSELLRLPARPARVRPASSRTGPPRPPAQPSSEDFISSSAARPCSCTSARRSSTDASGALRARRPRRRRATRRASAGARRQDRRRRSRQARRRARPRAWRRFRQRRNARMPSATSAILMSLRTAAMVPRPPRLRSESSDAPATIPRLPASPRLRPFPAAPSAVRPIQTEGRRTGT